MPTYYNDYDVLDSTKKPVDNGIDKTANSNQYMELRKAILGGTGTMDMVNQMESLNKANNEGQVTAGTDLAYLRSLIEKQPTTQTATAQMQPQSTQPTQSYVQPVRDNTGMIQSAHNNQLQSIVSQIKSAIAQSKQGYQNIIQDAPKQFQVAKNQAEVSRMRGLNTLQEAITNRGDRGGVGRSEMLQADIAGQNTLNNIEAQQNKVITDAQRAIANLEEQGRFAEAQAVQENAYRMLQDMIGENRRIDDMNLNIAQMLGIYGGQRTLAGQQFDRGVLEADRNFNYQVGQDTIANQFRQDQFNYQKQSDTADRAFREKQFDESIRQNNIAQENWQKQFTYQQIQDKIQNSLAAGRISMDKAQLALQQAKFAVDQDPNSIDNQIKKLQLDMAKNSRIDDIRARAVQIATTNGYFDQDTYESILKALQGNTAGTGMQQKGLSIDDDLSQYFK